MRIEDCSERGVMIHADEKSFTLPAVNVQIYDDYELFWHEEHECFYGLYFEFGDERRHYIVSQWTIGLKEAEILFNVEQYMDAKRFEDIHYVWLCRGEDELIKRLLQIKNAALTA